MNVTSETITTGAAIKKRVGSDRHNYRIVFRFLVNFSTLGLGR